MITVKVGDDYHVHYQFLDLLTGDFFRGTVKTENAIYESVFVRSGDREAVDVGHNTIERFNLEDIVEPIYLEWERGDEDEAE